MLHTPEETILNGLIGAVANRQQLLANNLANVTTSGYVRRDMDFNTVMRDLKSDTSAGNKNLDKTIKKAIYQDNSKKPTLEKELSAMYENQLKYMLLVKLNGHIYKHMEEATQAGRAG